AVEHLGQFSVGRTASTGSVFGQRQHLKAYPQCKTAHGIRCAACNSGSIKNWGFSGPDDTRRLFICNQCNARLYRAGSW
ncbi:hypothetical protein, partial [Pseudomonas aeruginosa]